MAINGPGGKFAVKLTPPVGDPGVHPGHYVEQLGNRQWEHIYQPAALHKDLDVERMKELFEKIREDGKRLRREDGELVVGTVEPKGKTLNEEILETFRNEVEYLKQSLIQRDARVQDLEDKLDQANQRLYDAVKLASDLMKSKPNGPTTVDDAEAGERKVTQAEAGVRDTGCTETGEPTPRVGAGG